MTNELIVGTREMPAAPVELVVPTEPAMPAVLAESLGISDLIVKQRYLQDLSRGEVLPLPAEEICEAAGRMVRLFRICSMTYEEASDVMERFSSVFSAISRYSAAALYLLRFDGSAVSLYLGVGCNERAELSMVYETFRGAFEGNFTGTEEIRLNSDENETLLADVFDYAPEDQISIAAVSGTLEEADQEQTSSRYGLERLIDGMRGERFDLVILADTVRGEEVSAMRDAFERLHSQLSPFCEQSVSISRGETDSYGNTLGGSINQTLTKTTGISHNWGRNWSTSETEGKSQNEPTVQNKAIAIGSTVLSILGATAMGATGAVGTLLSSTLLRDPMARTMGSLLDERHVTSNKSTTTQDGGQEGGAEHEDISQAESLGKNWSFAETLARTLNETSQFTFRNRAVTSLMDTIDQRIDQMKQCESGGAFSCAAYILAADNTVANRAASLYRSALMDMSGKVNNIYTNVWDREQDTQNICRSLRNLRHPGIRMRDYPELVSRVAPPTLVSAKDMPRYFMLPRKSLTGVYVQEHARFARDVPKRADSEQIHLGNLYHMGLEDRTVPVGLDVQSLTMHTFVTGTTGMGKSTVIYSMLAALRAQGVRFMVIEPIKGEYKNEFGNDPDVHVYGTNAAYTPLLRINPFRFPKGIHVLEHMDGLIEILTVCWPLYAAMPAVLKKAVELAYEAAGWDLKRSRNRYGEEIYPTFRDVMEQTYQVLEESRYSNENKGNYIGSLCMRLEKLTTGMEGMIFTSDDLTDEALFDENVIVDISRIRSEETKSLIMGMLIFKMQEYRQSTAMGANQALKHVTVLEEAHQLMRRSHVQNSGEGSAIAGKSVEMISNAIAEIRSYGEGFIIADQAPSALDEAVIRNTNTKIVMCLPEGEDRILTGQAMGLKEEQIRELSQLERGVAAVYQNNWPEAVLVRLPRFNGGSGMYRLPDVQDEDAFDTEALRAAVARNRLSDWCHALGEAEKLALLRSDVPTGLKCAVLKYMKAPASERTDLWSQAVYALFGSPDELEMAAKARSVAAWRSGILNRLQLPAERLSARETDMMLAALLREMMLRDAGCSRLFCEYMESLK